MKKSSERIAVEKEKSTERIVVEKEKFADHCLLLRFMESGNIF